MNHRLAALTLCTSLFIAAPASADVASIYAQAQGGVAAGQGVNGQVKSDAFHDRTTGVAYGALVGIEFLFIDAWVEHNQYLDAFNRNDQKDFLGTWTQFMVGIDIEADLGHKKGAKKLENGKTKGGYMSGYAELGMAIGFGVGTGQQVDPPLDNSQVTDKGFLAEARLGVGMRLSRLVSLGITIPVQYGYMFKSGPGVGGANEPDNQYMSLHGAALVNLRMKFQLK